MIVVSLNSTESAMFRFAITTLLLALVAATSFVGAVPATSVCAATGQECGSGQCCGVCCEKLSEARRTCCSKPVKPQNCQCSVNRERPAVPQERRPSDERNDARRAESVAAVLFVHDDEPPVQAIGNASLLSSQPSLRRQAIFCRWLI